MLSTSERPSAEEFQLREAIARRHAVERESIILFQETGLFLVELFKTFHSPHLRVITAAPAIADIPLAADRAEAELVDCESGEPFTGNIESLKRKIKSITDIIYLANPNRLTGASYANSQLKTLASLVKEGLLIIDEYYHDFSRLSALPLLNKYHNLVVLRVIKDWSRTGLSDFGYAIINESLLEKIELNSNSYQLERAAAKKCLEIIDGGKFCDSRVALIQNQALDVAKKLSGIGIKCQLSPTNFILLQVANPDEVQKILKQGGIKADALTQNADAPKYLRIQISGSDRDNQIIEAFSRMPDVVLNSQAKLFRTSGTFTGSNKEKAKSTLS